METELRTRLASIQERLRDATLGSPLTSRELSEFESAHAMALPEEYQSFLLHVGSGGGGLPRLGESPSEEDRPRQRMLEGLRRPFPLTEYWTWDEEEPLTDERQALRERVWHDGSLALVHDGCGIYWHLVVTGSERGRMWFIAFEGAQPCAPGLGFLAWYERWLDDTNDFWPTFKART